jgi:hypothetical protein
MPSPFPGMDPFIDMSDDSECPECHSSDLTLQSTRDRKMPQKGEGAAEENARVMARTLWIRCNECGCTWCITKKTP